MTRTFDFRGVVPAHKRSYKATDEQVAIVHAYDARQNLTIEAGAGAGKTSTLRMIGEADKNRRGVALAYNKSIATDMKMSFPANVKCSTAHSAAFGVGRLYAHRLAAPRMPGYVLTQRLGIRHELAFGTDKVLKTFQLARIVMETISKFCYSDDVLIAAHHVPFIPGMTPEQRKQLISLIEPIAQHAWDSDIIDTEGTLPFTHDNYLKIWQLGGPILNADFVMLDEAQDANPVIAAVVNAQSAQKILVGDSCQAIYGWRGAVDAMQDFDGHRLFLSQSFRFGQPIADEANKFLRQLKSPMQITGFGNESRVDSLDMPRAILTRTNAAAVISAMDEIDNGRRTAIVGGGASMRALANAAESLMRGEGTDHPELCLFKDWSELTEYVENDQSAGDLKVLVKIVNDFGADAIIRTVDQLTTEESADVIISTAHKSKGREWETVKIGADFDRSNSKRTSDKKTQPSREELMLAYVAVTRAKKVLDRGGLTWVDSMEVA